ncbi:hypothetical protein SK128_025134 [Halocaridina rubra]|uniref:Uncharacterized protein n=1 Tax=Halocaridina rubra TaxID=373956 RepID=A0AAN8WP41_HALRR
MRSLSLIINATVERLNPSEWPMFIAASPFLEHFTISNLTSLVMVFLFFEALPSEESPINWGSIVQTALCLSFVY